MRSRIAALAHKSQVTQVAQAFVPVACVVLAGFIGSVAATLDCGSERLPLCFLPAQVHASPANENKAGASLRLRSGQAFPHSKATAPHQTAQQGATRAAPTSEKVRPTHYQIDVAFEPEKHFLRATAAVTLRVSDKVEAIEFELNPRLTISQVTDEQGRNLEFIRSGRLGSPKLLVRLAEPVDPGRGGPVCPPYTEMGQGQTHRSAPTGREQQGGATEGPSACVTLTFAYEGVLPPGPLDYITKDGILLRDEARWYPATDLAAFAETYAAVDLPPGWSAFLAGETGSENMYRKSQLFEGGRKFSSRAFIAIPADWWPCQICSLYYPPEVPRTAISCLSVCEYDSDSSQEPGFVESFWHIQEFCRRIVGAAGDPFGHMFRMAQGFPGQQGAIGYSAPGFLVVSGDVVKWHDYPGFVPEFLPHEIAHQWFPIEVTMKSEEDGWLAESVAEYLAYRYLEEKDPPAARRMVERALRDVLAHQPLRPLRLGLKLFALENWDVTHDTLYQRGMLVFRMLETVIGRSRVDRALSQYYQRHRGGPAAIADFRKICEEISERDLGWFFEYFINGTELPEISLRRVPSASPGELAGEIHVRNVPPEFQVRAEMRVHTEKGTIEHSVATRGAVTPFAIEVPAPVIDVTFDPAMKLLRISEPAQRHRRQVELLRACGELERDEEFSKALDLCKGALAADPENLAQNHQFIYFQIGRLHFRMRQYDQAWQPFERALAFQSLDPMETDLYVAWARVYRARIAQARGDAATARKEAEAGLALRSPALETRIAWPEVPDRESTARAELRAWVSNDPAKR